MKISKKIRSVLFFIIIAGFVSLGVIFEKQYKKIVCTEIKVNIKNYNQVRFIDSNYVIKILYEKFDKIVGQPFSDIKLWEIEQFLKQNPYIESVQVYRAENNKLVIDLYQKVPQMLFIFQNSVEFYVDDKENIIPSEGLYPYYCKVITMNLPIKGKQFLKISDLKINFAKDIYSFVLKLNKNKILNPLIDQIDVQKDTLYLIPKVGNIKIKFGKLEDIDKKLDKLEVIFTELLPKAGWQKYTLIDISYKNQIVCKKRK